MKEYILKDAEKWREYVLSRTGKTYSISKPVKLYISESGSHRVLDDVGVVHWISSEDVGVIRWRPKDKNNPVKF